MKRKEIKKLVIRKLVINIVFFYVLLCAMAYLFQDKLLFPAHKRMFYVDKNQFQEISHTTDDGIRLTSWYVAPKDKNGKVVLYLHGNGGNISYRVAEYTSFVEEGYGLFALDYRGYGKSEGNPNEKGLYNDARSAIKYIESQGFSTKNIILYGESLGSGIAIELALEMDFYAIILESPFTSMIDVGKYHYPYLPVSMLLTNRFDSISKLKNIDEHLLIMHGTNDKIVPYEQGVLLFNALKKYKDKKNVNQILKMVTFKNKGHNNHDIYETKEAWKSFLSLI